MSHPTRRGPSHRDHVDGVLAEWRKEQPTLDTSPVAVVARIGRAAALLDRGLNANFSRYGINRTDWDALASLRRVGAPYQRTPTALYRALMRTSGGITHIVDRLEQQDLVERIPDPADRRGLLVRLTGKGRDLVDRAGLTHLDTERRMLAELSKPEQTELARLLRKLLISLEKQLANVPATTHPIDAHPQHRSR